MVRRSQVTAAAATSNHGPTAVNTNLKLNHTFLQLCLNRSTGPNWQSLDCNRLAKTQKQTERWQNTWCTAQIKNQVKITMTSQVPVHGSEFFVIIGKLFSPLWWISSRHRSRPESNTTDCYISYNYLTTMMFLLLIRVKKGRHQCRNLDLTKWYEVLKTPCQIFVP